jgi:hypothetical protein
MRVQHDSFLSYSLTYESLLHKGLKQKKIIEVNSVTGKT